MPPKRSQNSSAFKLTQLIQEDHGCPIYNVQFNTCDLRHSHLFATVGSNRATVYECLSNAEYGSGIDPKRQDPCGNTRVLQAFFDENISESFFSCVFSIDEEDHTPLLAIAGLTGLIKIIDLSIGRMVKALYGHGNSVNDLKIHPQYPCLVLSASKDESVRLWNMKTSVVVLIFAGSGGHRNEVLSVDFHPSASWSFLSCGMDNSVKIWDFSDYEELVLSSMTWDTDKNGSFPTKYKQLPQFSTTRAHSNYVDCVRWLGDLILSKSVTNQIVLWMPEDDYKRPKDDIRLIQDYNFPDADIWFIRFALDVSMERLAVGNRQGKVFVWEANSSPPNLIARLEHPNMRLPIRQTAFSYDGKTIVCCCEDGSIVRWDEEGN
mmetsp:Transcript_2279/g.4618  ORF Transcript_2279/g.4618 Transcript_2279/m.4618 type:complete len:377 (+) Transcript_2279:73-1203(+)